MSIHSPACRPNITVLGIKRHKQHNLRRFFSSRWGQLKFSADSPMLLAEVAAQSGTLLVWAAREPASLKARAQASNVPVLRIEDGFLRSNGLGSLNAPALSLVLDRSGIHYDASAPSDLETLLEQGAFDPATLAEAARLRERIVALGVSKFNLKSNADHLVRARPGQRRILVPGQVQDDASLRCSVTHLHDNLALLRHVRSNAPDAWIVYKPHPDVEAGKRQGSLSEMLLHELADQVLPGADITQLYAQVDEVHTISSTAGFEALLRHLTVVTYGTPFYAGWGLTQDSQPLTRRTRRLSLDELVAGVLLRYARYADPHTALPCDAWHALACLSNPSPPRLRLQPRVRALLNYTRTMLGFPRAVVPLKD